MRPKSKVTIATVVFAVLGGAVAYAQDKYSLASPDGIAFSDFRGYEDWAVVSSARTDEVLNLFRMAPRSQSSSGSRRKVRRHLLSWM
jgi:hypothetical protein